MKFCVFTTEIILAIYERKSALYAHKSAYYVEMKRYFTDNLAQFGSWWSTCTLLVVTGWLFAFYHANLYNECQSIAE